MNRMRLGYLLAALGIVAVASWFFSSFDRVTVQAYVGYRGEARRNEYLAVARLYERMDAPTRVMHSVRDLPALPARGVLLLPARRVPLGAEQVATLLAWVGRGGRLVVEAADGRERDTLLAQLGIARRAAQDGARQGGACRPSGPPYVQIPGRKEPLVAELPRGVRLQLPAGSVRWTADTPSGPQLAVLDHGTGQVAVATSLRFLRNSSIGRHDHAELAWILEGEEPKRPVEIYNDPRRLSLLDWLLEHAWAALAGAAILLAIWLWRIVPRFGPLAAEPPRGRRQLLEHLRAAGRHHWVSGNAAKLYAAARETCLARIVRVHPEAAGLDADATARRLSALLGLPAKEIESALTARSFRNADAFARAVSTLQGLHSRLLARPAAIPRKMPPRS